jgi:membrane dipeptidase
VDFIINERASVSRYILAMSEILCRRVLALLCGAGALLAIATAQTRNVSDAEVQKIQKSGLLIDTHNDITSRTVDGYDIGKAKNDGHTNLTALREGGVGAQFFAVYVAASYVNGNRSAWRTLEMIDTVKHDIIARYPNDFAFATTADDIERIHKQGKIAALMGIEGGHAIEDSLRLLRDYYELGIRYMTLTHFNTNNWADSSGDIDKPEIKHHNGLTDVGKQVVREMNRLGMMVDISHVADKTFWDALEVSSAPIFASHSSCRAVTNVPRNMTDEMIIALAKKGGVVQVNFSCDFLSQKTADAEKEVNAKIAAEHADKARAEEYRKSIPPATLADVVAHIDHVVKVAGINAVGIGSDFDGIDCAPAGLEDVSKFPNLTRALLEKGYTADDIRKIYGGNLLRVMRAVEAESKRLRAGT